MEALNARDYVGSSGSANLAVYKNYSLLVNEEISVDSIDKLIKKNRIFIKIITVIRENGRSCLLNSLFYNHLIQSRVNEEEGNGVMRSKTIFCKNIFQSCLVMLLLLGSLFSLSACADDEEKAELASYHWETVEVSREEFRIPENYMNKGELYLFASRDILDSHYDLSKVTLGGKRIKLVDSQFNLPSSGYKALFLVGKFDLKDKPASDVLKVPGLNKTGNVAVGYKKK